MSNTITLSYTNDFKPINNHIPTDQSLRIHCVSVRFNKEELDILNKNRGDKSKGEWLRLTSLDRLPPVIPSINLEAWKSLSDIAQKLNKLINHLDAKSSNSELTKTEIFAVKKQIKELRLCLTASELPTR
ncbi:hypothetical protein AWD60_004697 [Escherichia coli]|jgi:hypothetical protein|uniref:Uncharacterized protein n=1 Tax=Enterobacter cloacae TaxID=550 RepID=A0A3R8ZCI7_ENTCL|nr:MULTISPECIES: hypothetical protein [Enterobacterales]EAA2662462.1 hypothetical protein [Salmonella enterica subsp. enterica serovar Hadar]EAM2337871.1 hypothetical protein [Salmonella enterica]ECD7126497.1 hypothetical protein [Salmonella enterica subsp. enterica serovar Newport]EDR2959827.1 hypothetical protein [Salmonella enterica subsp. enterica serovar Oranienburg]EDT1728156.1 hypothetical protein [Salmonella enterica subsp. enterica]EDT9929001.1 hypothetical protein [Salmonella enteri